MTNIELENNDYTVKMFKSLLVVLIHLNTFLVQVFFEVARFL